MTRASRIADPIDIGKVAKPPPIRLPDPMTLFACRAGRFADVASGNPMADFLSFMAEIARAQAAALGVLAVTRLPRRQCISNTSRQRPPKPVSPSPRSRSAGPAWRGT
jgi:FdhE protein